MGFANFFLPHSQSCESRLLASSYRSIRMDELDSRWEDFHEIWYMGVFGANISRKCKFRWKLSSIMYKFNQQDATLYNILYYCQSSTCFGRFLRPSSGAQKLYTQHRVYVELACCIAASKLDMYPMLCVQFLSSWWWAEKPPETCRGVTVIKNIV